MAQNSSIEIQVRLSKFEVLLQNTSKFLKSTEGVRKKLEKISNPPYEDTETLLQLLSSTYFLTANAMKTRQELESLILSADVLKKLIVQQLEMQSITKLVTETINLPLPLPKEAMLEAALKVSQLEPAFFDNAEI